jgi:hypothetical protein
MVFGNSAMLCPDCYTDKFRLSRLRLRDVPLLAAFKYPIRCKNCKTRIHTSLPQAFDVLRKRRTSSQSQTSPQK